MSAKLTEDSEAVIKRDDEDAAVAGEQTAIVGVARAPLERLAADDDQNRQQWCLRALRNKQCQ